MASVILVVDDRPGIRRLLQEVLQDAEYRVITAAGGREALDIVEQTHVDLVLLDMKMSGMDGLETLTRMKECASGTVILIMTAYEELEVLTEARRRGAAGYISKPFDIEELKDIIARSLRKVSA
jgi:two-component system response regulator (stage 0 sporulation protein F)